MGRKGSNFVERSLVDAASFLKNSVFAEEYASTRGFLQMREPRLKTCGIVLILLAALFTKSAAFLFFMYILCLLTAQASSIRLSFFLKRTWVFIPIFSLIIAVPAMFAAFSPGEPVFSFKILNAAFTVTKQGLAGAGIFFMRILTSVSWAVLLSLTTRHFALLKTLRNFGIPQIFVMTLGMCYRYIYLFMDIFQNTYTAVRSRVGLVSSAERGRRLVAWNIANLWQRSYQLHNSVFEAMLSRGYNGEVRILDEFCATAKDWLWFFAALLVFLLSIWKNYLN